MPNGKYNYFEIAGSVYCQFQILKKACNFPDSGKGLAFPILLLDPYACHPDVVLTMKLRNDLVHIWNMMNSEEIISRKFEKTEI